MTSCMSSKRSNQLSYASATMYIIPYSKSNCNTFLKKSFNFFDLLFEGDMKK